MAFGAANSGWAPQPHPEAASEVREISAALRRVFAVALDQRHLGQREQQRDREHAPGLEADPELLREIAPDDLVEAGEEDEEERPAPGEHAPAVIAELQRVTEERLQERLLEQK